MDQMPFRPLLRTQADVEAMWRRLMSPLGFSSSSLWMVVVEGEHPRPQVCEFADVPAEPREKDAVMLAGVLEKFADPEVSFAFLRSRAGGGRPDRGDLAWARTLYAAGQLAETPLTVIHLAHDHDIVPMPMDDLLAALA